MRMVRGQRIGFYNIFAYPLALGILKEVYKFNSPYLLIIVHVLNVLMVIYVQPTHKGV